jgi:hypothetical protein
LESQTLPTCLRCCPAPRQPCAQRLARLHLAHPVLGLRAAAAFLLASVLSSEPHALHARISATASIPPSIATAKHASLPTKGTHTNRTVPLMPVFFSPNMSCQATLACVVNPPPTNCMHLENSSSMIENKLPLPRPGLRPLPSEEEPLTGITMLLSETHIILDVFLYAASSSFFLPLSKTLAHHHSAFLPLSNPNRHKTNMGMALLIISSMIR